MNPADLLEYRPSNLDAHIVRQLDDLHAYIEQWEPNPLPITRPINRPRVNIPAKHRPILMAPTLAIGAQLAAMTLTLRYWR